MADISVPSSNLKSRRGDSDWDCLLLGLGRLLFEFISGTYEALLSVSLRYALLYFISNLVGKFHVCMYYVVTLYRIYRILLNHWIAERSHRNWPPLSKHAEEGADARARGGFCSGPLRPAVSRRRSGPAGGMGRESRRMPSHDVDRISRVCNPNVVHLEESAMFSYSIPSDEMIRTVRFG